MPESTNPNAILPTGRLEFYDQNQRTSFSGADFLVLGYRAPVANEFGHPASNLGGSASTDAFVEFANLQTLSVSTTRDLAAERRLGTSWVNEYSRGSRSVAGTLAFTLFDGDAFTKLAGVREGTTREDISWYSPDDLPEFNIVLSANNEYGHTISGILLGVVITNTGTTVGVQDVYTEQVASYVARRWVPFKGTLELSGSLESVFRKNDALNKFFETDQSVSGASGDFSESYLEPLDEETIKWKTKGARGESSTHRSRLEQAQRAMFEGGRGGGLGLHE